VYVTRGDLDGAMKLYQQSAAIEEQLGNLQGKASTLNNVAVVLFQNGEREKSLALFFESLSTFAKIGAAPNANTVANLLLQFKQAVGAAEFSALWQKVTSGAEMPEWLSKG
jgi:Tetratricopeptide repeat